MAVVRSLVRGTSTDTRTTYVPRGKPLVFQCWPSKQSSESIINPAKNRIERIYVHFYERSVLYGIERAVVSIVVDGACSLFLIKKLLVDTNQAL